MGSTDSDTRTIHTVAVTGSTGLVGKAPVSYTHLTLPTKA